MSGTVVPAGIGTVVASSPPGPTAPGAVCNGSVCTARANSTVVLTAPLIAGYTFASWSGCTGGSANGGVMTFAAVVASATCQANYRAAPVTVSGTVTPRAATIHAAILPLPTDGSECPNASCETKPGDQVLVYANDPAPYFVFDSWTGEGCVGTTDGPYIAITAGTRNVVCQANFIRTVRFEAVIDPLNFNAGIQIDPRSGSCDGSVCRLTPGSAVAVTASSQNFRGWSCSDKTESQQTTMTLDVTSDLVCTARYFRLE